MFEITEADVFAVYESLKDKYPLQMTTAKQVDEAFEMDCPILVGRAHGQMITLYEYGGDLILDVMDEAQTKGTHWHPWDVKSAAHDIAEFMDGREDYELYPFSFGSSW